VSEREWIRGISKAVFVCALSGAACSGESAPPTSGANQDAAPDGAGGISGGASGGGSGGSGAVAGGSGGSSDGAGGSTGGTTGDFVPDPATISACTARIDEPACGGDFIGTWVFRESCVDLPSSRVNGCREKFHSAKNGSLTLNADGTYRWEDQSRGGYILLVCDDPAAASCDNLLEICPQDPAQDCPCPTAPTGVCACPGAGLTPMRTSTGTWSIDPVTQNLLLSENFGSVGGFEYCAQDNSLALEISRQIYLFSR
jgi:hypothetical protein